MNRHHPGGAPPPEDRRMQSLGSGFIIDPSGLIVTNNHVIEGADEITVTLQDNTTLKAKLVGQDDAGDLALLKVDAGQAAAGAAAGGFRRLPGRRLGAGDRQPVRAWRDGDGRDCFGARTGYP